MNESRSVVSDFLWPHGLYRPRNFPSQNTGVGSLSLLQGIFPTERSNPGLLHCRRDSLPAEPHGKPTREGKFKVSLPLISYFYTNFPFKCFLLCNHPLCFFFSLTLLRLSMAKLKIYFGKCLPVLVTSYLKICGLFSSIFWYWFLT